MADLGVVAPIDIIKAWSSEVMADLDSFIETSRGWVERAEEKAACIAADEPFGELDNSTHFGRFRRSYLKDLGAIGDSQKKVVQLREVHTRLVGLLGKLPESQQGIAILFGGEINQFGAALTEAEAVVANAESNYQPLRSLYERGGCLTEERAAAACSQLDRRRARLTESFAKLDKVSKKNLADLCRQLGENKADEVVRLYSKPRALARALQALRAPAGSAAMALLCVGALGVAFKS